LSQAKPLAVSKRIRVKVKKRRQDLQGELAERAYELIKRASSRECAGEDWLTITDLADCAGVSYSKAAVETQKLVERGLVEKRRRRKRKTLLYRTSRKGKRVADQIRRVLEYLA